MCNEQFSYDMTRLKLFVSAYYSFIIFSARQHAEHAICYRKSICLSVAQVDQSKTVEVRIMQFSPYSSPIRLVFDLQVSSRNSNGITPSGGVKQWWVAALRETGYFRSSKAFARWICKLDILSQLLKCIRQVAGKSCANRGVSCTLGRPERQFPDGLMFFLYDLMCVCIDLNHTEECICIGFHIICFFSKSVKFNSVFVSV